MLVFKLFLAIPMNLLFLANFRIILMSFETNPIEIMIRIVLNLSMNLGRSQFSPADLSVKEHTVSVYSGVASLITVLT